MENLVYKPTELTYDFIESIKFNEPTLEAKHYFISCDTEFYIQLTTSFHNNFYKHNDDLYINILCQNELVDLFIRFDNMFIKYISNMFPLWFNKEISVENLMEYYVPSILIDYDEEDDNNSDDSSDDNSDDNSDNSSDDKEENKEENDENETRFNEKKYMIFEIPYELAENDIDIMVYDKNENIIEKEDWVDYELYKKNGTCVAKLKGIRIENSKFYAIWEIIQIQLL